MVCVVLTKPFKIHGQWGYKSSQLRDSTSYSAVGWSVGLFVCLHFVNWLRIYIKVVCIDSSGYRNIPEGDAHLHTFIYNLRVIQSDPKVKISHFQSSSNQFNSFYKVCQVLKITFPNIFFFAFLTLGGRSFRVTLRSKVAIYQSSSNQFAPFYKVAQVCETNLSK